MDPVHFVLPLYQTVYTAVILDQIGRKYMQYFIRELEVCHDYRFVLFLKQIKD